eukprot:TRINITY_DN17271_c1_g1_i1.p1 TRINITY_DN17271_c1_g1~~TRINITY_DN17271_c1_g1_i1.p1  ORF type:complete len:229 (+),score=23.44 TRINITY_DN17271_c1_g1_i1:134-820(+)
MARLQKYWQVGTKAICAGRNYVAHAAELNNPLPANPFFFLKPRTAFLPFGEAPLGGEMGTKNAIEYPKDNDLHYEVELMVIIGKRASKVPESKALEYVAGYSIGLDMTLRDVQDQMKEKKLPWTAAKAFDTSLPLGPFIPAEDFPNPNKVDIWMSVNDEVRQSDSTELMIFSVERLIADATQIMTLEEGDILATGTPKGVGRVKCGDVLKAGIKGFESLDVEFRCVGA